LNKISFPDCSISRRKEGGASCEDLKARGGSARKRDRGKTQKVGEGSREGLSGVGRGSGGDPVPNFLAEHTNSRSSQQRKQKERTMIYLKMYLLVGEGGRTRKKGDAFF